MDDFGRNFLVATIIALTVMVIIYVLLAIWGPKNSGLYVALALYIGSFAIPAEHDRLMTGIVGITRFSGFLGFIVAGIAALVRKYSAPKPPALSNESFDGFPPKDRV